MKRKLLIFAAADGIKSQYTGVGVVVSFFFEAFKEIKQIFDIGHTELIAVTPKISTKNKNFDSRIFQITHAACFQNKGYIHEIADFRKTESLDELWFGNPETNSVLMWESISLSLASFIDGVSVFYDEVTVIAHDTIFAKTSCYLTATNVFLLWIPHSLGSLFNDHKQKERIQFEKEGINDLVEKNFKIGIISNLTKDCLVKDFKLNDTHFSFLSSGIYLNSNKYLVQPADKETLKQFNIPQDKKIILSWGRCSFQKGIDFILDAIIEIGEMNERFFNEYHLVLICPIQTGTDEYVKMVKDKVNKISAHVTFIDSYQETLQFSILKYQKTALTIIASRFESFGLTSIEAKLLANKNVKIIYTGIPTFKEVFDSSTNAWCLQTFDGSSLSVLIKQVLSNDMVNNQQESDERYNFVHNYANALKEYLS